MVGYAIEVSNVDWDDYEQGKLPWLPLSLVLGVVDHGRLPLAVHLVVPVLWLGGVGVGHVFGLIPVLGLAVLGVVDLLLVVPVLGLGRLRVLRGDKMN